MKVRIVIDADIKGLSWAALEACESEMTDSIDEAVEGGSYYLTHPETDREYEPEVSVTSVRIEKS